MFEYLYDAETDIVAEHTDIDDERQTVTVEPEPDEPGSTKRPHRDDPAGFLPTVGSDLKAIWLAASLALILAGGAGTAANRRRNNQQN